MMHGRTDLDTGRKGVNDQSAGFALQNSEELLESRQIIFCAMHGGRQLPRQALGHSAQLVG